MKTAEHMCPFDLKTVDILKSKGFTLDDNFLNFHEEIDAFQQQENDNTTRVCVTYRKPRNDRHGAVAAAAYAARMSKPIFAKSLIGIMPSFCVVQVAFRIVTHAVGKVR